jgi:hypothetical protein
MLAAVLWHEMAHLAGADEREARGAEEKLWTRFVRDGLSDAITSLRYLRALTTRPNDQLLPSADVEDHTSSLVAPNSGFHCHTGYSVRDCNAQLTRLRDVLAGLELTPLGDWTWILVRSDDWKPILRRVGRDPDSPAFTILETRQTFLEQSLFTPSPDRSRTLLEKWRIPLDQLLAFAISHELGHALCHEKNEVRANAYAAQLRSTGRATCK